MNGLMVAYYGNRAPKAIAPSALARQVTRFSGWTFVLTGLVYAGFWAFAPLPLATTIGTGALAAGVIMVLGYCIGLRTKVAEGSRRKAGALCTGSATSPPRPSGERGRETTANA